MMSSSGKLRQSPKKGPGKVKEYVKTSSKPRSSEMAGDVPSKELSYPYIKVADNEHLFPRYFTVLNRSEEDGIGMEDMDALQLEMEAMLSTIVKRNYILNDEIQVMNTAEEKRDKKNKANMSKGGPPSPGKRSKHHEKPVKKLKDVSKPKDTNTHSPLSIKINKNKVTPGQNVASSPAQTAPMSDPHELPDQTKMGSRRVLVPKNDTPNKFWLSVEPYCADILPEDIKLLDMMIQEHDQDTDYQKIPPLGRHYSLRWAQEDMLEEQDAASSQGKIGKGKPVELPHLSRRVDRPSETVGPLTQRLITSFMEENVMVPVIEPPAFDRTKVRGGENATPPRLNTFRNFTTNNSMSMERRIRKELEDQGLLDPVDPSKEDPVDDEILAEIKRCQTELKTISAQNFQQLKRLKKLATEEVMRQDLKKKLQHVDNEILEVFWRIHNTKLKKLPIMKREQELAVDALKEREALLKQIECVGDNA